MLYICTGDGNDERKGEAETERVGENSQEASRERTVLIELTLCQVEETLCQIKQLYV